MPAPAYLNRGMAATIATAMQAQIGVCRPGDAPSTGPRERQTVVSGHAEAEPDRRRHDAHAADEYGRRYDEQVDGGPELGEVGVDDLGRSPALLDGRGRFGMAMRLANRKMPPMTNAPPTEASTAWGSLAPRVVGLFRKGRGGVKAVDDEQGS